MDELKKITDQIAYLFLMKIADGLDAKTIEVEPAKELARNLLAIEPFTSLDDAKEKIHAFTSNHEFLHNLNDYIDGYEEEQKKHEVINKMREFMQQGKIDEAIQVARH